MSYNLPLLSIPAFYVLGLVPHVVAATIAGTAKIYNNVSPGSSRMQEQMKKKLSAREHARIERSKSCHRNAHENMPLYIAAILAGVYAERETSLQLGLTTFAASFLVVRALYTVNYITVETQMWSYVRSLLYFIGVGLCVNILVQSARALGAAS